MVQYMHKLVYNDLNRHTVKNILKQLRKLPWDSENEAKILETFVKSHKGKYGNIHVVASLASALSQYHDTMGTKLVDTLLQNVVHGLEVRTFSCLFRVDLLHSSLDRSTPISQNPDFKYQQRRVVEVKYLGELYNYRLIESGVIFYTLYILINHVAGACILTT